MCVLGMLTTLVSTMGCSMPEAGQSSAEPASLAEPERNQARRALANKAWADVAVDSHGTVLVRRSGTTYQTFVVIEADRISEIGDFRNSAVEKEAVGRRCLVKVTYTAGFGTGVLHQRMMTIVIEEHTPAKFVDIPAGGYLTSDWGLGKRSVSIAGMVLQRDQLQVKYVLTREGASDETVLKTYTLSTNPKTRQDCRRVWRHLGFVEKEE